VSEEGPGIYFAAGEGFFHNGPGDKLSCAGGDRSFDKGKAVWGHLFADGLYSSFQGGHFGCTGTHIAEIVFCIVTLDINDDTVGEFETVTIISCHEGFLLENAAFNHRVDFGVLGFYRGLAAIEQRDFPIAARTRSLAADNKFTWFAGFFVDGVSDDGSHNRADKADAHNDDDFLSLVACGGNKGFDTFEFCIVLVQGGDRKFFTIGAY